MEFIIIGSIVLMLLAATLAFTCVAFRMTFYSPKNRKENYYHFPKGSDFECAKESMSGLIKALENTPCEDMEITSFDGLKLRGRYYHYKDGAPVQIQFHGYRGTAFRDLCGGSQMARDLGFNTILVDQRAHGKSEGTTITFGANERFDCLSWINYAIKRFGDDVVIYISGVSMGATTVLMASGLDLPSNVKGVFADCPFSSPEAIIKKTCRDMGVSPKIAFPFLRLGARLFGRFNVRSADAIEAVKSAKIPILLIHGDTDTIVPCEMSKKIYESNPDKITFEVFPNAGHGMSYIVDTDRYLKLLHEFFNKCENTIAV